MTIKRYTPLKRSAYSIKRTPLRKVSKKRNRELQVYMKLRAKFLDDRPWCEVEQCGCTFQATDIHHREGRGSNLNKVATWIPSCRSCHTFIHNNAGKARELGLLK
jgi:hypothetical protein